MGKRPRKGGYERDAFCDCWYHRRYRGGPRAEIKRMVRRRERRQQRQMLG